MNNLKQKIRPFLYHLKHYIVTPRALAIIVAGLFSLSWVILSVMAMQQNYVLQKKVDRHKQQLALLKLETEALEIEKEYYKSAEYQELAVRKSLGLGNPGEKVLILPPYTTWVSEKQAEQSSQTISAPPQISNFNQWINFLFGANRN